MLPSECAWEKVTIRSMQDLAAAAFRKSKMMFAAPHVVSSPELHYLLSFLISYFYQPAHFPVARGETNTRL